MSDAIRRQPDDFSESICCTTRGLDSEPGTEPAMRVSCPELEHWWRCSTSQAPRATMKR
jgi:hypothetical protein